jgi:hypothetical protein
MDIHGYIQYPTYWIYSWISMDMDIHCRVLVGRSGNYGALIWVTLDLIIGFDMRTD